MGKECPNGSWVLKAQREGALAGTRLQRSKDGGYSERLSLPEGLLRVERAFVQERLQSVWVSLRDLLFIHQPLCIACLLCAGRGKSTDVLRSETHRASVLIELTC